MFFLRKKDKFHKNNILEGYKMRFSSYNSSKMLYYACFATSVVTSFLVDGSKKVSTYIVKGSK